MRRILAALILAAALLAGAALVARAIAGLRPTAPSPTVVDDSPPRHPTGHGDAGTNPRPER